MKGSKIIIEQQQNFARDWIEIKLFFTVFFSLVLYLTTVDSYYTSDDNDHDSER